MPAAVTHLSICTAALPQAEYRLLELPDDIAALVEAAARARRDEPADASDVVRGKRRRLDGLTVDGRGAGAERDDDDDDDDEADGGGDGGRVVRRLTIKGRHNDEAVLCTPTRTYALREIVQSNSLLLCSLPEAAPDEGPSTVGEAPSVARRPLTVTLRSNVAELLELVPTVPRLDRIDALLRASQYDGEDRESIQCKKRRYTPKEVRSIVQASRKELEQGLEERHVLLMDGYYRQMSGAFLTSTLQALLSHVELASYIPSRVPLGETQLALAKEHGVAHSISYALLTRWFGGVSSEPPPALVGGKGGKDEVAVRLDGSRIVRYLGLQILARAKQPTLLSTLMEEWIRAAGASFGAEVDLEMLRGEYLLHPAPHLAASLQQPTRIQHFPRASLPSDPPTRFQELFAARAQWLPEDLSPYLEGVAPDAKRRDALLLKFARASKVKAAMSRRREEGAGKGEVGVGVGVTAKGKRAAVGTGPGVGAARPSTGTEMREVTLYSARFRT